MRSVRLDPKLDKELVKAAKAAGQSVSEFIRVAVQERCDRMLRGSFYDRVSDLIGSVRSGGGDASKTREEFGRALAAKDAARQKLRRKSA